MVNRVLMVLGVGACVLARLCPAFDELPKEQIKSVERGTQWLIKAQNGDGSWGMDYKTQADVAATCISGLALLAAGNTNRDGPDPACVKALDKAVQYVLKRARNAGAHRDIAEGERSEVQTYVGERVHTFFAVLFLSQVYGSRAVDLPVESYNEMKEAITKMTNSIAMSQESDGSWHKETYSSLQATAYAWMALRSADSAGIPIRHAAVDRTMKFIKNQFNSGTKLFNSQSNNEIYSTASAMRILHGMGKWKEREDNQATDTLLKMICKGGSMGQGFLTNTGEDFTASVLITHALVKEGGERWECWFDFVRTRLLKIQNADGSWTATSCLRGRTFPTACAMLCLQTPYRLLPILDL